MGDGIFGRAWRWFTLADDRSATFTAETPPRPIDVMIREMMHGTGRVTRAEALGVPAVLRGRNLIASISTLPLVQYGPDRQPVPLPLLDQIDPDITNEVTLAQTVEDLLFEGVSWWRITGFGWDGYPVSARHLDYGSVTVQPSNNGRSPAPLPSGIDPRAQQGATVYVDGDEVPWPELIRFDSPNPPLLVAAGNAIRRAIALNKAAEVYANNPRPGDFFTPKEGVDPDVEEVRDMLRQFRADMRSGSTGYFGAALEYHSTDVMSPADLQLLGLQMRASLEIANALGLDPEDLGVSTTSRTYQNAVDRRKDRINDTLAPYMAAISSRLSMGDVTKRGHRVRFDLDDYMRADPMTRVQYYQAMKAMGALTAEEIRAEESLPALTAAQKRELAPAEPTSGQDPVRVPNTNRPVHSVNAGQTQRDVISFEADDSGTVTFDVDFANVDVETRTITGLAVPYNRIAMRGGRKFRFAAGSLQYDDLRRVKLLRDHQYSQAVGKATSFDETPDGPLMAFKVARGDDGDKVLALAEDGVLDGLSVGVDIQEWTDDPNNRGVTLVTRARLKEVSLTAMPAFDDARLVSVAASADEGESTMDPEATTPVTAAAPVAVPAGADQHAQFAAFLDWQRQTQAAPVEQRQIVNPTRSTATTFVEEGSPYRFDREGSLRRGTHEFSSDLMAASRGDSTAYNRVFEFISEQFVITTDVDELNPVRQRPDLFVRQLQFRYPVWNAIRKGTLDQITAFTFPKFNSAATLVSAHTEGTEPSLGTYTTTSQTVTPTAKSGKVKISRETWDQVGNPQISNLLWQQMLLAWYEMLEAQAVLVLTANAASITDIALTTAGADSALDQEITAAFAALQYVRGGFSMDNMFTQIDLYKKIVAAKDSAGRRLYPAVGPQNALGTVSSKFGSVDINGVTAYPSWALAATGSVAASSFLFDSGVVHGWASAPERIELPNVEVANLYIGIWGYVATAISDFNGVREISYDPV